MKKNHFPATAYYVFILLFVFATNLSAADFSIEKNGPIIPECSYIAIDGDSLKGKCQHNITCGSYTHQTFMEKYKQATCNSNSYDPHSKLLYYTELEAGRVTFYIDAYYGQSLKLDIHNRSGGKVRSIEMKSVDKNYLYVDLAAWDCGDYFVLLTNGHGETEGYSFAID